MHEDLVTRLTQVDQLGPLLTNNVMDTFQQVVSRAELEEVIGGPQTKSALEGRPQKRPLPKSTRLEGPRAGKLNLSQKKIAPKIHNKAIDLIIKVTEMLTKLGNENDKLKVSEEALDCLVNVGRLSITTLYYLETLLAPPALSLDQMSSNFVTLLIPLARFREAKLELNRTRERIQQHVDSLLPPSKRHCAIGRSKGAGERPRIEEEELESQELTNLGFGISRLPLEPQAKDRSLYLLVLTMQVNLLRVYVGAGEIEELKALATAPRTAYNGSIVILQNFMKIESEPTFLNLFCRYFSSAADRLIQTGGLQSYAMNLHLYSIGSLALSKSFSCIKGLEICYKLVSKLERNQPQWDVQEFQKFYEEGFRIIIESRGSLEANSSLDFCNPLVHYLGFAGTHDWQRFKAAFDHIISIFEAVGERLSMREQALGRWIIISSATGLTLIEKESIVEVCHTIAAATNELDTRLQSPGDSSLSMENLMQSFRIVAKAWSQPGKPRHLLPPKISSHLLKGIALLLSRIQPFSSNNLVGQACDLLLALREPLLAHNASSFWEQLKGLGEYMLGLNFSRGWQVLSSLSANCGAITSQQSEFELSANFFSLSVKLLERLVALEPSDAHCQQLASRCASLAKVLRANNQPLKSNRALLLGIKHAPSIQVGVPLSPDELAADTGSERLKLVEYYTTWNLATVAKKGSDYHSLNLAELQLEGLALAAILERELHHLQSRPMKNTYKAQLSIVDQLLEIYRPVQLHRLRHARALLIKTEIRLGNLVHERISDILLDLRRNTLMALENLKGSLTECHSNERDLLLSRAHLLLGTLAHEAGDCPKKDFLLAIQHLDKAYSKVSPPSANSLHQPTSPLAEVAFMLTVRFQGLLALRKDRSSQEKLCLVQLAICGARAIPGCFSDVLQVHLHQSQLFQDAGNFSKAKEIITTAKGLINFSSNKVASGCIWRLGYAKFFLANNDVAGSRKLLGTLAAHGKDLVKPENGPQRLLSLASQVYSQFLLVDGDLDSAIASSTQHHRLCFKAIFTALINLGIPKSELSALDNTALLARFSYSQEHQLLADLLLCFCSFGQLYIYRGSPKDAEHMFKHGLHLAEGARATSFKNKFNALLADLQCRRHQWAESQGLSSSVTVQASKLNDLDSLESVLFAIICQGNVCMGKGHFRLAHETYEKASELLYEKPSQSSNPDQLPIFLPRSANRFLYRELQTWLVCLLGWSKSKMRDLNKAEALLDGLKSVPLPQEVQHVYHLAVAKVAILQAIDFAKSDAKLATLLDSVWSLPPASHVNPGITSVSAKSMSHHFSKAATHLKLALNDATHFGLVKDLAEVCLNSGMTSFFRPRLGFPTDFLPEVGLSTWSASHLEIYKAISYRRELKGLLPAKLGQAPSADADWPRLGLTLTSGESYWEQVLQSYAEKDPTTLMNQVMDLLPESWAVCSMSFNPETEDLFVTRFQSSLSEPVLLRLPTRRQSSDDFECQQQDFSFTQALAQLQGIIDNSTKITRRGPECDTMEKRKAWWQARDKLNNELEHLLAYIESIWLNGLKGIMAVCQSRNIAHFEESLSGLFREHLPKLQDFKLNQDVLKVLLQAGTSIKREEMEDLIFFLFDSLDLSSSDSDVLDNIVDAACQLWAGRSQQTTTFDNEHLILILDKHTQSFPWESMPMLLGKSVSRLPSLHFLNNILIKQSLTRSSLFEVGHVVNQDSAFYVLNPEKDLISTQMTFQNKFQGYRPWTGTVGSPPSPDQLESALSQKDLYIYIGHGSGAKYIRGSRIKSLEKCSVALLLGCSSGALHPDGDFDSSGDVMSYLMAGSPTVLATLWDVTDKDLDRFTLSLFKDWGLNAFLPDPQDDFSQLSLTQAVAKARQACQLKYLVGAAPVVYGIPCYLGR